MRMNGDNIDEIRRENALGLAKEAGSKRKFADQIDRSPGQVGQFIGKTPTKNIGKALARHIENSFNKPLYWLDTNHHEGDKAQGRAGAPDAKTTSSPGISENNGDYLVELASANTVTKDILDIAKKLTKERLDLLLAMAPIAGL